MSTITADANLHSILSQVREVIQILDAHGNVLGTYTPKAVSDDKIKRLFNLEHARKKLATEKARPFREMIDNLEKLAETPK